MILMSQRNQLVFFILELNYPRGEIVKLPTYFLYYIVNYAVQFVFIPIIKELHIFLFVITTELRVLLPEF